MIQNVKLVALPFKVLTFEFGKSLNDLTVISLFEVPVFIMHSMTEYALLMHSQLEVTEDIMSRYV